MSIIVKYQTDYSGLNPNNLVVGEVRDLVGLNKKLIAPRYGAFYEENLVITDFYTNAPLVPNIDFVIAQLEPTATQRSGKAVYQFILIKNTGTTKIRFNYQTVGGPYSLSADAIAEFVAMLESDDRTIAWGDLIGVPSDFPPTPHSHDANDLFGMNDVVMVLESLRTAILTGDAAAQSDTINYVISLLSEVKDTKFATAIEATNPNRNDVAMSPITTKLAILQALSTFNVQGNNLEFSGSLENDSWGYIRDRNSGWTMCYGSSIDLAPEAVYRVNFKRWFNNVPLVVAGDIQATTDASSSGSQWVEVVAKIPQHTVDQTGFVAIGRRLSGSNTDTAKLKYIAIGFSDSNQPTTYTEGYPTTVPALPSQVLQPVWSGTNNITAVNAAANDSKRVGVVFPSTVQGGGYTINTNGSTAVANCYYTPYPGSFVDANYEVYATVEQATSEFLLNMNYIGVPLNQWIDLSVLKSAAGDTNGAGFIWEATGVYGGQVKLTVTIRNKTQTAKSAIRVFYIGQASAAYNPGLMVTDAANAGFTTVSYNTNSDQAKPLAISFAAGINEFNFKNSFAVNKSMAGGSYETPVMYGYYGPTADATQVENNASLYEVKVVPPAIEGFEVAGSELAFNTWYGLDVLRAASNANQEFILNLSGPTTALAAPVYIYVRHKFDHTKSGRFTLYVNKIGTAITPQWQGNSNLLSYPLVGGNKTLSLDLTFASPAGVAVANLVAGGNKVTEYLTYTHGIEYWNETEYTASARVLSSIVGGGSFTSTGSPLGSAVNTTTAVFSWTGSNPTDVHMQLVVEVTLKHKTLQSASAVKVFTFDLYGYGYTP
jgi:hypothetical protein